MPSPRLSIRSLILFIASLLSFSVTAPAEEVSYSAEIPLTTLGWSQAVFVPQFNPQLGILQGVIVELRAHSEGHAGFENLDPSPSEGYMEFAVSGKAEWVGSPSAIEISNLRVFTETVGPYDGSIDFAGSSGVMHSGISFENFESYSPPMPQWGPFIGQSNIALVVTINSTSLRIGPGNVVTSFGHAASAGQVRDIIYAVPRRHRRTFETESPDSSYFARSVFTTT